MIFCSFDDVKCPVDCLCGDKTHELMGKGKLGYREAEVGGLLDSWRKSKRASDYKAYVAVLHASVVNKTRQFLGGVLLAFDAKSDLVGF